MTHRHPEGGLNRGMKIPWLYAREPSSAALASDICMIFQAIQAQAKHAKGQDQEPPFLFDEAPKVETQQIYHSLQWAAARLSIMARLTRDAASSAVPLTAGPAPLPARCIPAQL